MHLYGCMTSVNICRISDYYYLLMFSASLIFIGFYSAVNIFQMTFAYELCTYIS